MSTQTDTLFSGSRPLESAGEIDELTMDMLVAEVAKLGLQDRPEFNALMRETSSAGAGRPGAPKACHL